MTVIFFGLLVIQIILSVIVFCIEIKEERANNKLISGQKARLERIENELTEKYLELEKESADKLSFEKKMQEAQAQLSKLGKELTSYAQVYEGLKGQYGELERDMDKLQQELANKDAALKTEQMAHREIKEKYESLFPANKRDLASS